MKRNLILSLVAGLMLIAQTSFARINPPPKIYPDVEVEESPYKLSGWLSLSYEQKAEENSKGIRGRGLGLYFAPKFEFYDFSIRAELFYAYDLNQPSTGSDWADGVVSLLYKGWKLSAIKLSPYTSVELPLSTESRENREIELVNNIGLLAALDTKSLNVPALSLSYSVAYGYYTNKYTTRVNGEPATEYKIVQTVKAGYNFNPVSVGLKFKFTSSYSYEDVVRSGFYLQETIGYELNKTVAFSLYHYNAAPLLKDATYENNLHTYDRETSTVGVSTDLSF